MKKLTIIAAVALLSPLGARECLADYRDLADRVETVADFWVGGYLSDSKNSVNYSLADAYNLPEAATRVGSNRAMEYNSPDSSASGGFLFKSTPLPSRLHLEFDYYNDNDWFGDLRYSYKDYVQVRLLPRRFVHNLDNLTIYDFNPVSNFTPPATYVVSGTDVEINDALVDDYGLRIDIDQYRLRLKTPNFPVHLYSDGEIVKRTGKQQLRFLGGSGTTSGSAAGTPAPPATASGRVRVSESRNIDQQSREFSFGANTHLGPVEMDLSHRVRKFENDVGAPGYDYEVTTGGTVNKVHNLIPEVKATTNTFKIHTSHTGRIFASATYSEIDKTNEDSGAEAENSMAYGELTWLPVAYLSLTTKVRHQKNEATAPASVLALDRDGAATLYSVIPGVASKTDTGSVAMRYSLVPKTNLSFMYTKKIKTVADQSVIDWSSRPVRQEHDVYELGFTNWVIPKVRLTGKVAHTQVSTVIGTATINNDPKKSDQANLGLTWSVTPKLSAFLSASVVKERDLDNRVASNDIYAGRATALRGQYLASFSYRFNDKLAITPTYTYMNFAQKRNFNPSTTVRNAWYDNSQIAQNFALNLMFVPTKRLTMNTVVDYTITKGVYDPTSPLSSGYNTKEMAMFSDTNTEEINVRLDSEYDLGQGWGVGLALRYVDWKDTSIDNPSDGSFVGGLFKVSKKLYY